MSNNGLAPLAGPQSIAGTDLEQQRDTFGEDWSSALGSTTAVSMLRCRSRWAGEGFVRTEGGCLKLLGSRAHLELIGSARLKVTQLAAEVNVSCRVVDLLPAGADIPNRQPAGPQRRPVSLPGHVKNAPVRQRAHNLRSGPPAQRRPNEAREAVGYRALLPCMSRLLCHANGASKKGRKQRVSAGCGQAMQETSRRSAGTMRDWHTG